MHVEVTNAGAINDYSASTASQAVYLPGMLATPYSFQHVCPIIAAAAASASASAAACASFLLLLTAAPGSAAESGATRQEGSTSKPV